MNLNQAYITMPARIVSFDKDKQTATIQLSAEKLFGNAEVKSTAQLRKPLLNVPVHTVSGGGWSLTMPIKEGNTCIMWFSQVGYDHWLYENKDTAGTLAGLPKPWLRRKFSKDDGFALVGMNPIPSAVKNFTDDGSQWRNEDAVQNIHLKDDLSIEINSPVSVTINAPAVFVNCETADINASTATTINSPATTITGTLDVQGSVTMEGTLDVTGATTMADTLGVTSLATLGGLAVVGGGAATMAGGLDAVGDITSGGISLSNHTHNENGDGGGVTDGPN